MDSDKAARFLRHSVYYGLRLWQSYQQSR